MVNSWSILVFLHCLKCLAIIPIVKNSGFINKSRLTKRNLASVYNITKPN